MKEGIELFGPFVCDAMLAPLLHVILRSDWIEERKRLMETSNQLKLGWAQEFYDYNCVIKTKSGASIFAHGPTCTIDLPQASHSCQVTTCILDKIKLCGCTPWAAVQAVRCIEDQFEMNISCSKCKHRILASCAFLMECAAVEASREYDWLVRNEAVIELCWLLYEIHRPQHGDTRQLTEAWAESIVIHSVKYQEHKDNRGLSDIQALVVIFANDHLPFLSKKSSDEFFKDKYQNGYPVCDPELIEVLEQNKRFTVKRGLSVNCPIVVKGDKVNISTAVNVLLKAPDTMEARAQEQNKIVRAIVSCFPRVAASALESLTLKAPNTHRFLGVVWPVYVNATRACYQLFEALALPVSPSPVYVLELLARGFRRVTHKVFENFIPMSSGGTIKVSRQHYMKHIIGPITTLAEIDVISDTEKDLMIQVLNKGVLPCFAGEGDSVPDRLISSTIALTFAASGLRVFEVNNNNNNSCADDHHTVTYAGLLYFAAWYVLVYTGALHAQPTVKDRLSKTGSTADKHLCVALKLLREGSDDYKIVKCEVKEFVHALQIVFGGLLDVPTILRLAELYLPELLAQLPYVKKLNWIPGSVKSAIESRDIWFTKQYGDESHLQNYEPPFLYLGNLAHGLHSSIDGSLVKQQSRPIAQAPCGPDRDFDPWCTSLMVHDCNKYEDHDDDNVHKIDDNLRISLLEESVDYNDYYDHVDEDEEEEESNSSVLSQTSVDTPLPSPNCPPRNGEDKTGAAAPEEPENKGEFRRICQGLLVGNAAKMGYCGPNNFLPLKELNLSSISHGSRRFSVPTIQSPCLVNIASTVYMKDLQQADTGKSRCFHDRLIDALWVLFMHSRTGPASATTSEYPVEPMEPMTPEALAVMVHLAVKSLNPSMSTQFGVCNNIQIIYQNTCDKEQEFIPIAAIVGGLFGVNIELNVNGCNYYIVNDHYNGMWVQGSLCYNNNNRWYVLHVEHPVNLPRENLTGNCYHRGTLGAYMRLNNLKVAKVDSDDYCGFHTVAILLGKTIGAADFTIRQTLVTTTVDYMIANKNLDEIDVYLKLNKIQTPEDLRSLLMKANRWLTVDEVSFILRANGKRSSMILESSYPIYNSECCHYIIKAAHFEPVLPV